MKARRGWGWPLVPVYAAGVALKDGLRALGVLRTRRLAWPVVSVGSLSAGGAGKTPVVIALVELLQGRGWGVDVLSRGYGRDSSDERLKAFAAQVVADLDDAASRFGDEPTLIARRLKVPVWVSTDRYFAGRAAEDFATEDTLHWVNDTVVELVPPAPIRGLHVLDDGFQHRELGRAVDVVLVTEEDLQDAMLPAGNRREPLRALRRADVVVLREEERGRIEARVRGWMRAGAAVWSVRRQIRFEEVGPSRCVVFCAIARPESFVRMLREAGVDALEVVTFADHHAYMDGDVERLVSVARECGAAGFLTTEKDAVKLTVEMRRRLEAVGPVHVARLDVTFVDEAEVVRDLERRIG